MGGCDGVVIWVTFSFSTVLHGNSEVDISKYPNHQWYHNGLVPIQVYIASRADYTIY